MVICACHKRNLGVVIGLCFSGLAWWLGCYFMWLGL
jgi:hypothetical protein